jgi:ArsR family metal-binding transcriptional regulator
MLINDYRLEVEVSKHSAEEFEYEAIAHLPVDIREVMPYLNATLRGADYMPAGPVLAWRKDDRGIGFWPDRIAVDHLESREQAAEVISELVAMVNGIWERRGEIEPDHKQRERLQPLELYRLLPRTNCKVCGQDSCLNFALKLAAGLVELRGCTPLYEEDGYSEQREKLESIVSSKEPLLSPS